MEEFRLLSNYFKYIIQVIILCDKLCEVGYSPLLPTKSIMTEACDIDHDYHLKMLMLFCTHQVFLFLFIFLKWIAKALSFPPQPTVPQEGS